MKVILAQDAPNIGKVGEVVVVKDGYARNFLIPKGIAMDFNPQNLKAVEEKKKKIEFQSKKSKDDAAALGQKLENISCTVAVKVIEEDRIFGSITVEMIQKALESEGLNIDKKYIQLEEHIKKLGVYQIPIKLHPEVTVSCKVWIVKE